MDPTTLTPVLQKEMALATRRAGKLAERKARQIIQEGMLPFNADLTEHIKGSDKPLVDTGTGIFQAITSSVVSDFEVFVGVLRRDRFYDIAESLHEGVTIKVTDRMRGMFAVLWQASEGRRDPGTLTGRAAELWARRQGGWLPLNAGTTVIKIPPRPFLEATFSSPELKKQVKREWDRAVDRAIKKNARKG